MLGVRDLGHEVSRVMVVDQCNGARHFSPIPSGSSADQIPQRLSGWYACSGSGRQPFQQGFFEGNAKTDQFGHFQTCYFATVRG